MVFEKELLVDFPRGRETIFLESKGRKEKDTFGDRKRTRGSTIQQVYFAH
jgi:hypothetical protein